MKKIRIECDIPRLVWISGRAINNLATMSYSLRFRQTGWWSEQGWLWCCRWQRDKVGWSERHSWIIVISCRWWRCYGDSDGVERELAESLVGTGASDWVDEEIAEVLCETWEGSGMAVRELGNSLSGRFCAVQLWDGESSVCWGGASWNWMWFRKIRLTPLSMR